MTCIKLFGVSTPGGSPPATSDIHDQCQDAVKMKKREEVERAAEAGNDTAVAVSIDRNEETGSKDIVSVRSRGAGLSPDLGYNAEDPAGKRETLSRATQLQESVEDRDNDSGGLPDVRQRRPDVNCDFKPDVSDRHAIYLNTQDEKSDAQRRVMYLKGCGASEQ